MKRGYLDISFTTIMAIIAGVVILVLALYGATKLFKTETEVQDVKLGKEIGILLNPLETSYETGKTTFFSLKGDTRIYNACKDEGVFGRQLMKLSQKSFGKWSDTDVNVSFENKYIFSKDITEGKDFELFSKSFEFPFKVADLIYITSSEKSYCFWNPPEDIEDELSALNPGNVKVSDCLDGDVVVCFEGGSGCDIRVDYDAGAIHKNASAVYFQGDALMYAGIFSDKDIYECQLKRLMKRTAILAQIYRDKANFVSSKGCDSGVNEDLLKLINACNSLGSSSEIRMVATIAQKIDDQNKYAICKLW